MQITGYYKGLQLWECGCKVRHGILWGTHYKVPAGGGRTVGPMEPSQAKMIRFRVILKGHTPGKWLIVLDLCHI